MTTNRVPSKQVLALSESTAAWVDLMQEARVGLGTITLLCVGASNPRRAFQGVVTLASLIGPDNARLLQDVRLVCPPLTLDTEALGETEEPWPRLRLGDEDKSLYTGSTSSAGLVSLLATRPRRSGIYVAGASRYVSSEQTADPIAYEWPEHAASLYRSILPIVQENELIVIIDTGERWPEKRVQQELLRSFEEISIYGAEPRPTITDVVIDRWAKLFEARRHDLLEHHLAEEFVDVEDRTLLAAHALARAGYLADAWSRIAPLTVHSERYEARMLNTWLAWSRRAEDHTSALGLLNAVVERAQELNETHLASLLEVALSIGAGEMVTSRISEVIAEQFPSSLAAEQVHMRHALDGHDLARAEQMARSILERSPDDQEASLVRIAAQGFEAGEHLRVVKENSADPRIRERVLRLAVSDLLDRQRCLEALSLLNSPGRPSRLTPAMILMEREAIEQSLLMSPPTSRDVFLSLLEGFCQRALRVLGEQPGQGSLRLALFETLSPETIGADGFLAMLHLIVRATDPHIEAGPRARSEPGIEQEGSVEIRDMMRYMQAVLESTDPLSRTGVVKARVPLGPHPKALLDGLVKALRSTAFGRQRDADEATIDSLLHTTLVAAREWGEPVDYDVRIIRLVACGAANNGYMQRARDLAEECLQAAIDGSPHRRRLAWLSFADIYHRLHDPLRSALALACALQIDTPLSADEAAEEYSIRARLLRDSRLFADSREAIMRARVVFQDNGLQHEMHRLEYLDLQLQFMSHSDGAVAETPESLENLAQTTAQLLAARLQEGDFEVEPLAIMLAEMVRRLSQSGRSPGPVFEALLAQARESVGEHIQQLLDLIIGAQNSEDSLREVISRLRATRDSIDLGTDTRTLVLLARRSLSEAVRTDNLGQAALAIELTADHTIGRQTLPNLVESPNQALRALVDVHHRGADVHLWATDSDNRMVRVSQIGGVSLGPFVEQGLVATHLEDWSKRYGRMFSERSGSESGMDAYHRIVGLMDGLHSSIPKPTRMVLTVSAPELGSVPSMLLRTSSGLLGACAPVAAIPSLAWLQRPAILGTGDSLGEPLLWIPTSRDAGALEQLATLVARQPQLRAFRVVRTPSLPNALQDAGILVVGIHGRSADPAREGSIAHDDTGVGRLGRTLAEATRHARIVVLLMCHGARLGVHPFAHAQVGLSAQCLEQGAGCVIAPLWALDVQTAAMWLAACLPKLLTTSNVAETCFAANQAVRQYLSHPADWMAMQVYGDPFIRGQVAG